MNEFLPRQQLLQFSSELGPVQLDVTVEGNGPTVVLLPSSQRDSTDFNELAARIASHGFRVLRPQPRGTCQSRGPMRNLTLHVLAGDVARAIEEFSEPGTGAAVVLGHAYGHFVARMLDVDRPDLVRGVVVAGAAAKTFPPGMSALLDTASNTNNTDEDRLHALRMAFFAEGNDPSGWLHGWYPALRDVYRKAGAIPSKDVWWNVAHAPILDLQAADDPWRPPATVNELKDMAGDKVTVQIIANASHALLVEQPVAVADAVVAWIRGTLQA